jgi:hypothetical protein
MDISGLSYSFSPNAPRTVVEVQWPSVNASYQLVYWDSVANVPIELGETRTTTYALQAPADGRGVLLVYPMRPSGRGAPFAYPINNPPSLAAIRWRVRDGLNDSDTVAGIDMSYPETPKWTDREINGHIIDAIGFFNKHVQRPVIIETTMDMVRSDLLRSFSEITNVRYRNVNEWATILRFQRKRALPPDSYWDFQHGELRITGRYPQGAPLEIEGLTPYPIPRNDFEELQIDFSDWDILTIYTMSRCYLRLAGQSAQLDRWKEEGKRNDNPITPIGRLLYEDALQRIQFRLGPRAIRRFIA